MGNRMMKDTIRTSKSVNVLSDFEFRAWVYLITYVDDFGRGSADPELLKGFVFPRRKSVTESQIQKVLASLANTGMINLYEVDGEPFFYFPNWDKHQRIQTKKSLFPDPPNDSTVSHGESPYPTVSHGESPPEIETETKEETETKKKANAFCAGPQSVTAPPPVIVLPLADKSEYPVTKEQCQEWAGLYPAVDVIQQLRNMRGWLNANPAKRKTKRGINRFINSWLAKEQDRGGNRKQGPQQQAKRKSFAEVEDEPDDKYSVSRYMRKNGVSREEAEAAIRAITDGKEAQKTS